MSELTPKMTAISPNAYKFYFEDMALTVNVDSLEDKGISELSIYQEDGHGPTMLDMFRTNLLNVQNRKEVVNKLNTLLPLKDWDLRMTAVTTMSLEHFRRGEPVVEVGTRPETMLIEYQVEPILEYLQPTILFGAGGGLKSYIGIFSSCLVRYGIVGLNQHTYSWQDRCDWIPKPGNVLYLDWETDQAIFNRRVWAVKRGLGIDNEETFKYLHCDQPLITILPMVKRVVTESGIDLVVVDSAMNAQGYGPDTNLCAIQMYNSLRSLRCTSLIIDHITKNDMKSEESVGPYGPVVKYNRARSVWEVKKSQETGGNVVELSLVHKKHNEGTLLPAIGIRVTFVKNDNNTLDKVTFESMQVVESEALRSTAPLKERMIWAIQNKGAMTDDELAKATNSKPANIKTTGNRHKDVFKRDGENKWDIGG